MSTFSISLSLNSEVNPALVYRKAQISYSHPALAGCGRAGWQGTVSTVYAPNGKPLKRLIGISRAR
jgi:hypothetical protein